LRDADALGVEAAELALGDFVALRRRQCEQRPRGLDEVLQHARADGVQDAELESYCASALPCAAASPSSRVASTWSC
jgi:hypothetical protein